MNTFNFLREGKFRVVYIGLLGVLVLAALPLVVNINKSYVGYFLFMFFVMVILAQGWNLEAGYTGQIGLTQNAFFGLGAYTTAIIWSHAIGGGMSLYVGLGPNVGRVYFFNPLLMILSGIVPIVLAIVLGLVLLSRLRGDYYSFGTLGIGMIITVAATELRGLTGGANGIHLPAKVFSSMYPYYYVGLFEALLATALIYFVVRSRIGLALRAIKDDEVSAASHGINILKYRVFAVATGAFLGGLAGNLYVYYLFYATPDAVLDFNWLLWAVLACVLGGYGTIFGPVLGALLVTLLSTYGSVLFPTVHPIITGVLIILVMKFMPSGIIGLGQRRRAPGQPLSVRDGADGRAS